jgi:hypothetical protein
VREIVGALLDPSRATDGPPDPWFLYPIGPPGLAQSAFNRVWDRTAVPLNGLFTAALLAAVVQAPPVFRAQVGVVRVEVLVTRGGAPVRGLTAADFELRDDGVLQELEPILEEQTHRGRGDGPGREREHERGRSSAPSGWPREPSSMACAATSMRR